MVRKVHTRKKRRLGMRGHHQSGAKVIRRMKKKFARRLLREQQKLLPLKQK